MKLPASRHAATRTQGAARARRPVGLLSPVRMAFVAGRSMSLSDVRERILALAPLAAGFALVPTLACAAGAEPLPPWPTLPLSHAFVLKHFTYVDGDFGRGQWWAVLASALCHTDGPHRDRNLLSLLCAGWHPAAVFGRGLAAVFFAGHLAAALNAAGHALQRRRHLDASTFGLMSWLTPSATRLWDNVAPPRILGGSAGVFALLGCDLCLKLEEAATLVRELDFDTAGAGLAFDERGPTPALGALLWLGVSVAQTLSLVQSEHRSLANGASATVGHAGHLSGFAVGIAIAAARLAWRRARQRRRWIAPGGRVVGGRRLGGR